MANNNNDDLIIGVSTDTSTISRALNKLVSDVGTSAAQIQSRFESVGKGIDKSMTTALQDQINGMVGIGVKATKEWSGALSDQGKQFDALRAKINPVFSTISNYKAAIAEIKTANSLGAISADEMASAISRERQAALSSIAAIKARNAAIAGGGVAGVATGGHGSAGGLGQTQMMALQHSVRSITEQLALGISPMQAFMGQLSHLSYVASGPGGAIGALKAIGDSVVGLVTRFPLLTAAVAAGGAAFLAYKLMAAKELPTVDEVLKRHGDYIKELKDYYDGAKSSAEKYGATASIVLDAITRRQAEEAKKVAEQSNREFFGKVALSGFITGSDDFVVAKQFKAAEPAILKFREQLAKGKGDFDAFNEAIQGSALSRKLKGELLEGAQGLRELNAAANIQPPNDYQKALAELSSTANGLKNNEAKTALQELIEKFKNGEISAKDLIHEIDLLSGKSLDLSSMTGELDKLIKKAEDAKFSIGTIYGMPSSSVADIAAGLRGPNVAGLTGGRVGKPSTKDALDQAQALFKTRFNFEQRFGGPELQKLESSNKSLNHVDKPKVDKDANAERDNLKRGQDRIDRMNEEIKTIGLNGTAQDTLRFKLELLQKATDKGRKLTPEYRAEIDKLTESYGKAAEKVAGLKLQQDLTFEREQMFRSPTEQRVYSQLKSAGLDPNSPQGELNASLIRMNESLAQSRDLALDFASGFASDLRNGVKATEALGNALGRLGDKLIDMALNQAINSLFSNIAGATGGSSSGGSIFGGIGKILGFADGTDNAPGGLSWVGERGPELMNVPKGAQIIPNHKLRGPSMPNLSYGGGGGSPVSVTYAPTIDARGADVGAVARIEQAMARDRAELPAHIVTTVRKAQKSRILS